MRTLIVPAILLALSIAGLVFALTGDGATDWLSALLLALPILAILRAGAGRLTPSKNTR